MESGFFWRKPQRRQLAACPREKRKRSASGTRVLLLAAVGNARTSTRRDCAVGFWCKLSLRKVVYPAKSTAELNKERTEPIRRLGSKLALARRTGFTNELLFPQGPSPWRTNHVYLPDQSQAQQFVRKTASFEPLSDCFPRRDRYGRDLTGTTRNHSFRDAGVLWKSAPGCCCRKPSRTRPFTCVIGSGLCFGYPGRLTQAVKVWRAAGRSVWFSRGREPVYSNLRKLGLRYSARAWVRLSLVVRGALRAVAALPAHPKQGAGPFARQTLQCNTTSKEKATLEGRLRNCRFAALLQTRCAHQETTFLRLTPRERFSSVQ